MQTIFAQGYYVFDNFNYKITINAYDINTANNNNNNVI